jgi:hypothetical protein
MSKEQVLYVHVLRSSQIWSHGTWVSGGITPPFCPQLQIYATSVTPTERAPVTRCRGSRSAAVLVLHFQRNLLPLPRAEALLRRGSAGFPSPYRLIPTWDPSIHYVVELRSGACFLYSIDCFECFVRFDVFTSVTKKNAVFWDWRRVALVRTDVSEERIATIIRMKTICELGSLAVPGNRRTLRLSTASYS